MGASGGAGPEEEGRCFFDGKLTEEKATNNSCTVLLLLTCTTEIRVCSD